jgi:FkbM family methyltransferase
MSIPCSNNLILDWIWRVNQFVISLVLISVYLRCNMQIPWRLKKPFRTAQSYFPILKEAKDQFYYSYRKVRSVPSEPFFAAIRLFKDRLDGSDIDVQLHVPSYRGFVYDGLGSLDYQEAHSWINSDTVYFFDPAKLVVDSHACSVETLDAQKLADPIFIKIDVQGFEFQVVKGGVETLGQHEPILLIEDFSAKPDLIELTASLGYKPYTFESGRLLPGASETVSFLFTPKRMSAVTGGHGTRTYS